MNPSSSAKTANACWFLTGPTASGKTAVGVHLARRIGAEIVSLDSMALYRGMDIGTAKPTVQERQEAPHHLIDMLEPYQECSLAQYLEAAHACMEQIAARGRGVLFVGGTPLYLKGLLRGVFSGPPADWDLRERLHEQARQHGDGWLHDQLRAVDPVAAERLHPRDTRRLIRALEVFEKTGRPISSWQQQFDVGRPAGQCRVFVLQWARDELHARIDHRVDEMFARGLVEEVRALAAGGRPLGRTAGQAVGYREVLEHLAGKHTLSEAKELVRVHTRQLAKRQETWFHSLSECRFVPVSGSIDAAGLVQQIAEAGFQARVEGLDP